MTDEEIKQRLEVLRPGVPEDRNDPAIREALEALQSRPELQAERDGAAALDARIADAFDRIAPPEDLKRKILAEARGSSGTEGESSADAPDERGRKVLPFPRAARRGLWAAAAAAALIVAGIGIFGPARDAAPSGGPSVQASAGIPGLLDFLNAETDQLKRLGRQGLELESSELASLKAFLREESAPIPPRIPAEMTGKRPFGCLTFQYGEARVSMLCFTADDGATYHLAAADASNFDLNAEKTPGQFERGGRSFTVWSEQGKLMVVYKSSDRERTTA